ncbi:MAG: hypothetical protein WD038_05620 [Balneolales bacterium]
MKKAAFIAVAGFFLSTTLHAQNINQSLLNNGSFYTYYGMGLPVDASSSSALSMGLQGVALQDYTLNNLSNPAVWAKAFNTNVSGGFSLQAFEASDALGSRTNALLQASQFQMTLPINRERMGVSLSLSPVTESRFQTERNFTSPASLSNSGEDVDYTVVNTGTGGLNRLELGFGIQLTEGLSFGYAPSLVFGVLENKTDYMFDEAGYSNVNFNEINSNYGFGNRFGLYLSRRGLIGNNDRASLGMTFNLPVNLNSESSVETDRGSTSIDLIPANEFGEQDIRMPMEGAVGFAYEFNPQWSISTDVLYQNWSDYRGRNEELFKDRLKAGFGAQFNAARRSTPGGLLTKFNYRAGVSYDTGSLEINETQIETFMLTAGLNIPTRRTARSVSSIDINFDFGLRGTEASELVAEKIYGLRVSFNLSETMFRQRRLN